MFRSFFLNRSWFLWSLLGTAVILGTTWYKVQVSVQLNKWYGEFFNLIQSALSKPNSISVDQYYLELLTVFKILATYIVIVVFLEYFIQHYVFRWRTAMNEFYLDNWRALHHIEGAAQRVQEDTMRFARIMETLGVSLMRSIMTLIAFLPILWQLSGHITTLPIIGHVSQSLVYLSILSALGGTVLLAAVGVKLPGLEFDVQKVEAAYRKELVYGEDDTSRAERGTINGLFGNVRSTYFRYYFHYLYFNVMKWSYLQGAVFVPYVALGPTIIAGAVTFGLMQRILNAFSQVSDSLQYLVQSWSTIVELISIRKRLKAFESHIAEQGHLVLAE